MPDAFGSFATLKNLDLVVPASDDSAHYRIERNFLVSLLAKRVEAIQFDEVWYLAKYPDVKEAVRKGVFPKARDHYVLSGYYEHRMPRAIQVNERWYQESYPDVADAVRSGVYKSAQFHFELAGFREGRMPYANFQL